MTSEPKREQPPDEPPPEKAGLLGRLKRHAKDATLAATSTHGGIAGGVGGRKARKKR